MSVQAIDAVFMVGGGSWMPKMKAIVQQLFKKDPVAEGDPRQAASLGAAIVAEKLAGTTTEEDLRHTVYYDMCPLSLGVNGVGGGVYKFALRGAKLPVQDVAYVDYGTNNTARLHFSVYQGERVLERDNRLIASFDVGKFPRADAGEILVCLTMTVDEKGQIDIDATASRREKPLDISVHTQVATNPGEFSILELANMYSVAEQTREADEAEADLGRRRDAIQAYYDNLCGFFRRPDRDPALDTYVDRESAEACLERLREMQDCFNRPVPTWDQIRNAKASVREMLEIYFQIERPEGPPNWMR
jgi:molecular chaperone HscA